MRNIGLAGYAGSGKDSAAATLCDEFGYTRVAFADPIKEALLHVNPAICTYKEDPGIIPSEGDEYAPLADVVDAEGWDSAKRKYPEVRRMLQDLGQSMREIEQDIWLDEGLRRIGDLHPDPVVVTDVRHRNEVAALRRCGFNLIWVSRPGVGPANEHESENSIGPRDSSVHIVNNGTLEDLSRTVRWLCR